MCAPLIFLYKKFQYYISTFYSDVNDSSIFDCFTAPLWRAAAASGSVSFALTSGLASSDPEKESSASPSEQIRTGGASVCVPRTLSPLKGVSLDVEFWANHSLVFHLVDMLLQCPALSVILSWLRFGCHHFACGVCAVLESG